LLRIEAAIIDDARQVARTMQDTHDYNVVFTRHIVVDRVFAFERDAQAGSQMGPRCAQIRKLHKPVHSRSYIGDQLRCDGL